MKLSSIKYSAKEGFSVLFRHPLILLASITTMILMLFLIGSFMIFSFNARGLAKELGSQPPIEVQLKTGVSEADVQMMTQVLEQNEHVVYYQVYSPEENYESFKKDIGKEDLFSVFSIDNIPYTINVRLDDPATTDQFKMQMDALQPVKIIFYENNVMVALNKIIKGVNIVTIIVFVILALIAFFIVSNMIRVSVLNRAEEINIMKYVGATNGYIRFPYVLEGLFVGFIGALLATLLSWFVYMKIYDKIAYQVAQIGNGMHLIPSTMLIKNVLLCNIVIGCVICFWASIRSVRKHIQV